MIRFRWYVQLTSCTKIPDITKASLGIARKDGPLLNGYSSYQASIFYLKAHCINYDCWCGWHAVSVDCLDEPLYKTAGTRGLGVTYRRPSLLTFHQYLPAKSIPFTTHGFSCACATSASGFTLFRYVCRQSSVGAVTNAGLYAGLSTSMAQYCAMTTRLISALGKIEADCAAVPGLGFTPYLGRYCCFQQHRWNYLNGDAKTRNMLNCK